MFKLKKVTKALVETKSGKDFLACLKYTYLDKPGTSTCPYQTYANSAVKDLIQEILRYANEPIELDNIINTEKINERTNRR